ncbi:serine/threonine-protein phosphatase 7 long form homolog [Lotus japonicus]|uniref:serine/threonine-protein phosphatase 7 long form homolog n=1 Tax=Lotus japonicus TaxID=34305 RepID=UPI002584FC02|nr:serine/threonine-protein phosphatase 7 long form homolog [Lotus japonicus]
MADEAVLTLGLKNPTLLVKQNKHVSGYVWNETNKKVLKLRLPHIPLNGVPPQIEPYVQLAGFYETALAGSIKQDKVLISTLLVLNIDGQPVTGVTWCDWSDLVIRALGVIPPACAIRGSCLNMKWLNQCFNFQNLGVLEPAEAEFAARAFILRLIGTFLLPDHSGSHVPLRYLLLIENLALASTYSWGSAVLATLYHELCHATGYERQEISGYTYLLQIWAWERIPMTARESIPRLPLGRPLAGRWEGNVGRQKNQFDLWRIKLDELRAGDRPYPDHVINSLPERCRQSMHLWRSVVRMICYTFVEWHQPDRALQQFDMFQGVLDPPYQIDEMHDISLSGKEQEDWVTTMMPFIQMWGKRHYRTIEQLVVNTLASPNDPYMKWVNTFIMCGMDFLTSVADVTIHGGTLPPRDGEYSLYPLHHGDSYRQYYFGGGSRPPTNESGSSGSSQHYQEPHMQMPESQPYSGSQPYIPYMHFGESQS